MARQGGMYQIQLKFMGQNKKITIAKELPVHELNRLVGQCFNLTDTVIGVTDAAGKFIELGRVSQELAGQKGSFSLVTVKELKQENMSFASEYFNRQNNKETEEDQGEPTLDIPVYPLTHCMGIISDLEMFEELVLPENKTVVVACFTKVKPPVEMDFEYYLYQNESKNSVLVYSGATRVCEFYVGDWTELNPEVTHFIEGLTDERFGMRKKRSYYDKFNL